MITTCTFIDYTFQRKKNYFNTMPIETQLGFEILRYNDILEQS